jgi:hypothetical protein
MPACPNCGHELPGTSHFGLKANAKNYIYNPIGLKPGRKYDRRFALLYYPPKKVDNAMILGSCLVIASEELPKGEKAHPFISGSKFYDDELVKLEEAVHQIIAADIAFTAHATGQALHSIYMRTLNSLYQSKYSREMIKSMAISMYDRMCDVDRITEQEEESFG